MFSLIRIAVSLPVFTKQTNKQTKTHHDLFPYSKNQFQESMTSLQQLRSISTIKAFLFPQLIGNDDSK